MGNEGRIKWATLPDLMIRYRAAAFWGRLYIPELLVGIHTQEEVLDVEPVNVTETPKTSLDDLNAAIPAKPEPVVEAVSDELF